MYFTIEILNPTPNEINESSVYRANITEYPFFSHRGKNQVSNEFVIDGDEQVVESFIDDDEDTIIPNSTIMLLIDLPAGEQLFLYSSTESVVFGGMTRLDFYKAIYETYQRIANDPKYGLDEDDIDLLSIDKVIDIGNGLYRINVI